MSIIACVEAVRASLLRNGMVTVSGGWKTAFGLALGIANGSYPDDLDKALVKYKGGDPWEIAEQIVACTQRHGSAEKIIQEAAAAGRAALEAEK